MIIFVLIFFGLTLYFAWDKTRKETPISNARRNWSYILGVIGIVQLLMGFSYGPQHFFIGAFLGAWAWFVYVARKSIKITWKTASKTIVLILSSVVYMATVNQSNSWVPVVLESVFLFIVFALQANYHKHPKSHTDLSVEANISSEENKATINRSNPRLTKRSKRIIYWIVGIILFIIILPFIIFAIDKTVEGYMHYYHSVQNIGKVEEVDSCVVTTEEFPAESYYQYENYCIADSCAE